MLLNTMDNKLPENDNIFGYGGNSVIEKRRLLCNMKIVAHLVNCISISSVTCKT